MAKKYEDEYEGMSDLEDVLSKIDRMENVIKEALEFIGSLKRLFGTWDAQADVMGEGTITTTSLLNRINDVLIYKKD